MSSDPNIDSVQSSDGVPYDARKTPSSVVLDVESHSVHTELENRDGFPVHHLYVRCGEIDEKCLPLDANPRRPSNTSQVRAMQDTLRDHPEDFVKMNNGMAMLCGQVDYSNGSNGEVVLQFGENEGICNGGHTYFAMKTTEFDLDENAVVHIEAIQIPDEIIGDERKEEIVSIARARNNNNRLERRSEANYLGYYDMFKDALDQADMVSWYEGDSDAHPDAIDAVHFIRLLKSWDVFEYYHPLYCKHCDNHKSPAVAKASIHNGWCEQMEEANISGEPEPLRYLVPLSNDLLELRDMVACSLKQDDLGPGFRRSSLFQEQWKDTTRDLHCGDYDGREGNKLAPTMEVLFTGLFRSNIWTMHDEDGEVKYTGWFTDPKELWDNKKRNVLESLADDFQDFDADPKVFIRATSPYDNQLFTLGYGQDPPHPEYIYDVESGDKYEAADDPSEATHWLDESDGTGLVSVELDAPSDTDPTYEEIN
jgi:hypothetical protein